MPLPPLLRRLLPRGAALLALVLPGALAAQERPRGTMGGSSRGSPRWFGSINTGFQWGDFVVDDASSSSWDFDAGFVLRGTIEREVAPRVAVGLAFNYARLPLTYAALAASSNCARCAADATVSSYGGLFRFGGGNGFHQVVELFLGAMRYGNFEQRTPRAALAPSSNTDFAFGAGYGFGYGIANDWQVTLIQDATNGIHDRSELPGAGRVARHYSTRLGLRVGF